MPSAVGNGPLCPVGGMAHGRTYSVEKSIAAGHDFWCPHSAHGGNGRYFTDKEAHGQYEITEGDVSQLIEGAARDVIADKVSLDMAVTNVARQTKMATSQAREALTIMIGTIKEKDEDMAEKKAAAKTTARAKTTTSKTTATGDRHRLEAVPGSEFARVRDEAGLTQKQIREACTDAGMGASSTYVYILTTKGASVVLFDRFKDAVASYVRAHKADIAAAKKVAAASAKAKAAPKAAPAKAAPKATTAKAVVAKAPAKPKAAPAAAATAQA